jgi:hypothetical protein
VLALRLPAEELLTCSARDELRGGTEGVVAAEIAGSSVLVVGAGVVVDDTPAVGETLEHQREHSTGLIVSTLQMPTT